MHIKDLNSKEYDPYYSRYIRKLEASMSLTQSFENGFLNVIDFFQKLPKEKLGYRYAKGKWNCKEILQHLIDTERIFMYRCFRIARNDKTELAGFNQNEYVEPSGASKKNMEQLLAEFQAVRESSISLVNSFTNMDLQNVGIANGAAMSARAAAFTVTGHEIWHMDIIKERYL